MVFGSSFNPITGSTITASTVDKAYEVAMTMNTKLPRWARPINGHHVDYHYTYNPERNSHIIVAKIDDDCSCDAMIQVDMDQDTPFSMFYYDKKLRKCLMAKHPTARASCDPRDTFDEEFGRNLAHDRLEVAYWSQYENRLGKFNEFLMEMFNKNSERMTKISETYLQRED